MLGGRPCSRRAVIFRGRLLKWDITLQWELAVSSLGGGEKHPKIKKNFNFYYSPCIKIKIYSACRIFCTQNSLAESLKIQYKRNWWRTMTVSLKLNRNYFLHAWHKTTVESNINWSKFWGRKMRPLATMQLGISSAGGLVRSLHYRVPSNHKISEFIDWGSRWICPQIARILPPNSQREIGILCILHKSYYVKIAHRCG